jgi:hypothetical protein
MKFVINESLRTVTFAIMALILAGLLLVVDNVYNAALKEVSTKWLLALIGIFAFVFVVRVLHAVISHRPLSKTQVKV